MTGSLTSDGEGDLVVRVCKGCDQERLTARTTDGRRLCSECIREVPPEDRAPVARGLAEQSDDDASPDADAPPKKTATEALREVLTDAGRWLTTTELSDQTGYNLAYVRETLRDDADVYSRNRGGPRPTEWAYPDPPESPPAVELLPGSPADWDGSALREARREAELTQTELAERSGISQGAISKWERGETAPGAGELGQLRSAFDTSGENQ